MLRIDLIAVGKMKDASQLGLWQDYTKRMQWPVTLHEIITKKPAEEEPRILEKLNPQAFLFVMDEHGKSLPSVKFSEKLSHLSQDGITDVQFVIGGADGLGQTVLKKADFLLSFGTQTWPHMMVRIMLAEQLYRAQQIIAGHPYHRE